MAANSKNKNTAKGGELSPYKDEIVMVVTLVVSILLILSYFNLGGVFGKGVNFVIFGMFGLAAYLIPFLLFFGMAFGLSNRGIATARRKLLSASALYIILTGILQLISNGYKKDVKLFDFFFESAVKKSGGGLIGGVLSKSMCFLFGELGAYAILIGLALILIMFITEKLLFAGLKKRRLDSLRRRRERRKEAVYQKEQIKVERTPPKVFTFSREEKSSEPFTREDGLENGKKKRKKAPEPPAAETFPQPVFAKQEPVLNADLSSLSIIRGYERIEQEEPEEIPTYEGEFFSKFKKPEPPEEMIPDEPSVPDRTSPEENEPVILSEERPEISDIEDSVCEDYIEPEALQSQSGEIEPIPESKQASVQPAAVSEPVQPQKPAKKTGPVEKPAPKQEKKESAKAVSQAEEEKQQVSREIGQALMEKKKDYQFPPLDLLNRPKANGKGTSDNELIETAAKLKTTLESFGVRVEMKNVSCGPTVTRYELQPAQGVKVSKITSLADDIKLSLAAADIRIEAPIPGKAAVGIEVPNKVNTMVVLRELLEKKEFKNHPSSIAFAVGKDIGGNTVVTDIAKMPHLLIAGATGSGKSVCINTLIMSILYKANPDDVKLIMVDPKVVELSVYNGIPHLLIPVVTDPKKASGALNWAVAEMTERYKKFADLGVRDVKGYNAKVAVVENDDDERFRKMPQIVIIVDELADLMMVAPGEVEDAICRLAQLARAAGIHLIIATQRPSVNVITGLIKANVPSRIAFSVSSMIDSRTILDGGGAEKLLGNGDMLFFPSGYPKPVRVQGSYVSDKEVSAVVEFLTSQNGATQYSEEITSKITAASPGDSGQSGSGGSDLDDYFVEAGKFIIEKDKASIGMLQRVFKIGFNRAARIMDQLYEAGVVGPEEGTKPRKIVMSLEEFEQYVEEYV